MAPLIRCSVLLAALCCCCGVAATLGGTTAAAAGLARPLDAATPPRLAVQVRGLDCGVLLSSAEAAAAPRWLQGSCQLHACAGASSSGCGLAPLPGAAFSPCSDGSLMLAAADILAALGADAHNSSEAASSAAAAGEDQQQPEDDSCAAVTRVLLLAAACMQPDHQFEPAATWTHAVHLRLPFEETDVWQLVMPQPEEVGAQEEGGGAERMVLVDLHLQQPLAASGPAPALSVLQAGDVATPTAAGGQQARRPQHSRQVWLWRAGLLAALSGLQLAPLVLRTPA